MIALYLKKLMIDFLVLLMICKKMVINVLILLLIYMQEIDVYYGIKRRFVRKLFDEYQ